MVRADSVRTTVLPASRSTPCAVRQFGHKSMGDAIQHRILRVISKSKHIPLASVQPDRTFEELSIDSLDRLNILFDLETEFEISIDDEEAKKATRISDIIAGIQQLLEVRERSSPGN